MNYNGQINWHLWSLRTAAAVKINAFFIYIMSKTLTLYSIKQGIKKSKEIHPNFCLQGNTLFFVLPVSASYKNTRNIIIVKSL